MRASTGCSCSYSNWPTIASILISSVHPPMSPQMICAPSRSPPAGDQVIFHFLANSTCVKCLYFIIFLTFFRDTYNIEFSCCKKFFLSFLLYLLRLQYSNYFFMAGLQTFQNEIKICIMLQNILLKVKIFFKVLLNFIKEKTFH